MKILGVETSSSVAGCAIADDERLLVENNLYNAKTHSQIILPMIDRMLSDCSLSLSDIDVFAVNVGPGSFTGLRIGAATVKGFAHALEKPVIGVSSLEVLAYNAIHSKMLICPMIDARCDQCYTALFESDGKKLTPLIADTAMYVKEICETAASFEQEVLFLGDGSLIYRDLIESIVGDYAIFAHCHALEFRASSLCALAYEKVLNGEEQRGEKIVPVYLRKPQAQRELERRMKENDSNRM
jgi:universal bacterial protein YeaZ